MMLDQKRAFDDLGALCDGPLLRDRVLRNQIYQQISSALAGSHEYAAMSRFYELSQLDRYDLLVMDTPPTENAIDFLDAPDKMAKAVDSGNDPVDHETVSATAGSLSLRLLGMGGTIVPGGWDGFLVRRFDPSGGIFRRVSASAGGFRERAQKSPSLCKSRKWPSCSRVVPSR